MAALRRQNLHARKNNRLFSLFVLFSHFRQHNSAPENFFFQMSSYARESTCTCMHNYWNFLENITWSELGKQSIQAKKVYSASYAGKTLVGHLKNIFYTKLAFFPFIWIYFFLPFCFFFNVFLQEEHFHSLLVVLNMALMSDLISVLLKIQ